MRKTLSAIMIALLLCAALALPAMAYPAGIDEALPRVVDNAGLLDEYEKSMAEEQIQGLIAQYEIDIVILTEQSIGSKEPRHFAADFFDYGGYGWREEETDDITTGSGVTLLLVNMKSDSNRHIEICTKGRGMEEFPESLREEMMDNIIPLLIDKDFAGAIELFLSDVQTYLEADISSGYNDYYNNDNDYDNDYDYGYNNGVISGVPVSASSAYLIIALIALVIALVAVLLMKRKMNTARPQSSACNYMNSGSFRLTQQQDTFLFTNTTRVRIDNDTNHHGGGGGFSGGGFSGGGGGFTSSSGSSHSSSGRSF